MKSLKCQCSGKRRKRLSDAAASTVMQILFWTIVVKRELSQKSRLLLYWLMYVPTLTYGHELWVMTNRMRLWIQATWNESVSRLSLRNRVKGLDIRRELGVRALLLYIKEPAEVVCASYQDATWLPSTGGGLGTSNWEDTPGQNQNRLESLYISSENISGSLRRSWRTWLG